MSGFLGGGGSGGTFLPYNGQVATRSFLPDSLFSSTTGFNGRCAHYMRSGVATSLIVGFPNFYVSAGSGEILDGGNVQTVTGSIEYPAGTFTQLKFRGNTSIASNALIIWSDPVTISIPQGALFFTRRYSVNSANIFFCTAQTPTINTTLGDATNNSNTDQTMGGTITDDGADTIVGPCAIIGLTNQPSICALGSSRMIGYGDTTVDSTGDTGYARFFGGSFAYMNFGISGDTMAALVAAGPVRMQLARFCSHLWIDPGLNDFNTSASTEAQVVAYIQQLAQQWSYPGRVIINNEGPWTTSSDNWATVANQTATSFESSRVSLNAAIAALTGYNQIVKPAALDTNSGSTFAWLVNGTANYATPDGIHEQTAQLLRMLAVNPFNSSLVHF